MKPRLSLHRQKKTLFQGTSSNKKQKHKTKNEQMYIRHLCAHIPEREGKKKKKKKNQAHHSERTSKGETSKRKRGLFDDSTQPRFHIFLSLRKRRNLDRRIIKKPHRASIADSLQLHISPKQKTEQKKKRENKTQWSTLSHRENQRKFRKMKKKKKQKKQKFKK